MPLCGISYVTTVKVTVTINRSVCYVTFLFPVDNVVILRLMVLKLHTHVAYGRGMCGIYFRVTKPKVNVSNYK
jgi:hypothetical protein